MLGTFTTFVSNVCVLWRSSFDLEIDTDSKYATLFVLTCYLISTGFVTYWKLISSLLPLMYAPRVITMMLFKITSSHFTRSSYKDFYSLFDEQGPWLDNLEEDKE